MLSDGLGEKRLSTGRANCIVTHAIRRPFWLQRHCLWISTELEVVFQTWSCRGPFFALCVNIQILLLLSDVSWPWQREFRADIRSKLCDDVVGSMLRDAQWENSLSTRGANCIVTHAIRRPFWLQRHCLWILTQLEIVFQTDPTSDLFFALYVNIQILKIYWVMSDGPDSESFAQILDPSSATMLLGRFCVMLCGRKHCSQGEQNVVTHAIHRPSLLRKHCQYCLWISTQLEIVFQTDPTSDPFFALCVNIQILNICVMSHGPDSESFAQILDPSSATMLLGRFCVMLCGRKHCSQGQQNVVTHAIRRPSLLQRYCQYCLWISTQLEIVFQTDPTSNPFFALCVNIQILNICVMSHGPDSESFAQILDPSSATMLLGQCCVTLCGRKRCCPLGEQNVVTHAIHRPFWLQRYCTAGRFC